MNDLKNPRLLNVGQDYKFDKPVSKTKVETHTPSSWGELGLSDSAGNTKIDLETQELGQMLVQALSNEQKLRRQNKEITRIATQWQSRAQSLEQAYQTQVDQLKMQLEQVSKEAMTAQSQLKDTSTHSEEKIANAQKKIQLLQEQLTYLNSTNKSVVKQYNDLYQYSENLYRESEKQKNSLRHQTLQLNQEKVNLIERIKSAEKAVQNLNHGYQSALGEVNRLRKTIYEQQKLVTEKVTLVSSLEQKLVHSTSETESVVRSLTETTEALTTSKKQERILQDELTRIKERCENLESLNSDFQNSIHEKDKRLTEVTADRDTLQNKIQHSRAALKHAATELSTRVRGVLEQGKNTSIFLEGLIRNGITPVSTNSAAMLIDQWNIELQELDKLREFVEEANSEK